MPKKTGKMSFGGGGGGGGKVGGELPLGGLTALAEIGDDGGEEEDYKDGVSTKGITTCGL